MNFFTFEYFYGSIICNQLGLDSDYRHGMYITKVLAIIWSTHLVDLIYKLYTNFCFKAFKKQSFASKNMTNKLIYSSSSMMSSNKIDRRKLNGV